MENHVHADSLHFMFYNFCRQHKTLCVSPIMAAGVTNRLWDVKHIVGVIEEWEATPIDPEPTENDDLQRLREDSSSFMKRKPTMYHPYSRGKD